MLVSDQPTDSAPTQQSSVVTHVASVSTDDAPYPVTFDELAEMIATGASIPGIKDIPNKLNDAEASTSTIATAQRVQKPWERTANPTTGNLDDIIGATAP